MKQGNIRNLILNTFLFNYKQFEPYCFWSVDDYNKMLQPEMKGYLNSINSTVLIYWEDGTLTPYGCPFTMVSEKKLKGWCIVNKPDKIVSFFVFKPCRGQGVAKELLKRAYIYLEQPKKVYLPYPTKQTFKCSLAVLGGRCRVFVNSNKVKLYD